ncbi:MAG TPA: bifunctional transaldolase/phosoglucose isomerase [Caulobacteraceae bacterium]
MSSLKDLEKCGQSLWLDYLKRSLIEGGELKTLIQRDGLKGVTSNPSIFEKAIAEGDEYDAAILEFAKQGAPGVTEIYEHLAIADIQAAADVLRGVYDATKGADGFVSLECSPYLANDTKATIAEARRLWAAVDRPNLLIKVPATQAGLPAIRALIGEGVNVNITLLFSVETYRRVAEAYIGGLEDLKSSGGDPAKIASVASFFVSRIDVAVDEALKHQSSEGEAVSGKVAIANAKIAYAAYKEIFAGDRWQALQKAGARTQRLLWASTSTKSKDLRDTIYVEGLVGRDTVDTMPPATMDAFRDHGVIEPDAIEHDLDAAKATLTMLAGLGIDLESVTSKLIIEGVQKFDDSFDELLGAIARRSRSKDVGATRVEAGSGTAKKAFADELEVWRKGGLTRRLWSGDASLWTGTDEAKWCGWLTVVDQELGDVGDLKRFAELVKREDFTDVVLLGMGGSSLGPEVLAEVFGSAAGSPRFHMLDSTDPAQVKDVQDAVRLESTLFIVSSKSGSTLEPNIFADYFLARAQEVCGEEKARRHFVAITDPGSPLEKRAKDGGWAQIFYGAPPIGGRYSVLSDFGLVPAAAIGVDVEGLLRSTTPMVRACAADVPPAENPGVQLGVALGVSATKLGRDKVTIIASPGAAPIGAWLEQLLAESTGKHGRGLIPVADEPLGRPEAYGQDRFFAYVELEEGFDPNQRAAMQALAEAGHPVATLTMKGKQALGQEFFRWEIAVAVAGAIIGIDPFDQPDVEASKDKTRQLMDDYEKTQALPEQAPVFQQDGVSLYADPRNAGELGRHDRLEDYLKSHFARIEGDDYAAFLGYVDRKPETTRAMTKMRIVVRDHAHVATCVGFGPRFQHSTGQAYKGGPNSGVFLQITCDDPHDLDVPGHHYSFGVVKDAQARGDMAVLVERDRRALRVHLKDAASGLPRLAQAIHDALG